MAFGYKTFFKFWVGNAVLIPLSLIIVLVVSTIIGMWSATYGLFLNGIGKIHLQLYVLGIQALLFFPLSYLFYRLGFGLSSLVVTQIIFGLSGVLFMTKQYKKIINKEATGIWFK
jgi:hypothetical protein